MRAYSGGGKGEAPQTAAAAAASGVGHRNERRGTSWRLPLCRGFGLPLGMGGSGGEGGEDIVLLLGITEEWGLSWALEGVSREAGVFGQRDGIKKGGRDGKKAG